MADWNWWPRFHDPALKLGWRDQAGLHWDANLRMLHDWRACWRFVWISLLPVPLLFFATSAALLDLVPNSPGGGGSTAALVTGGMLFIAYLLLQHLAFAAAMKRAYLPFVRTALTDRGHPVCLACGHLLGPCPPIACPECGSAHCLPR